MKRLIVVSQLALLAVPAISWAGGDNRNLMTPNRHWFTTIPLQFDSEDLPTIGGTEVPPGATERAVIRAGAQTWEDVACTDIDFEDMTTYTPAGVPATNFSFVSDGITAAVMGGPGCSPGVLAFNTNYFIDNTEVVNGRSWKQIDEMDTNFCPGIDFGTPAEIDSPQCVGQYDLQGITTHEFGHGIGYDHTCEADEACGDPELRGAVMYWAVGACDGEQRSPNSYDIETHSISYGLGGSSDLTVTNGAGGLPLDVTFTPVVIASASILSVDWDFGDATGDTTAGSAEHTYISEGRFSVGATIHANAAACGGDFTQTVRKVNVVVACNELTPEFRVEKDGKKVQFFSQTLGAAAGCLQTLNWDFGDGATANVKNPIHEYSSSGTYTVTLTASGPPGTSDPYTKNVKVSSGGGGGLIGCSLDPSEAPSANSAAAAGVLCIAVAMSLATVARRRVD